MGKFDSANNSTLYQELASGLAAGEFATPAYFNGDVYYGAVGDSIRAFHTPSAKLTPATTTANKFPYPGTTPSISANGKTNAILWAMDNSSTPVLHAYDATNLATELYNTNQATGGRDNFGTGNKYMVPTIANGKVYGGTTNSVVVFGLLPLIAVSVAPASGSGIGPQTFGYVFTDPAGVTDINYTLSLFSANGGGANGCEVEYVRAANALYLFNDAGTGVLGPVTPGANTTLSNSQCTLNALNSSTSSSGNNLTVDLNLTFLSAFAASWSKIRTMGLYKTTAGRTADSRISVRGLYPEEAVRPRRSQSIPTPAAVRREPRKHSPIRFPIPMDSRT